MAESGEDHGQFMFVGGGDHGVVLDGAAGLNGGGGAGLGGGNQTVGKRKEGIAAYDAAVE